MRQDIYHPRGYRPDPDDPIVRRKRMHDRFVVMARSRSAWVTSVPGATECTFDALPSSPFPDDLADMGYRVEHLGDGERILAHAVVERFSRSPGGALELLAPGSTAVAVEVRHHPGITKVQQFSFSLE